MRKLSHSLPNIGQTTVTLYSPADRLYEILEAHREVRRQNRLRHLGCLSQAHPGTRLARYDYTIAMLHFAQRVSVLGGTSDFRLGGIEFSSSLAALQTIALAWNIGHLPGTFGVEKGVYRFLTRRFEKRPTTPIRIAHRADRRVQEFLSEADLWLSEEGFSYLCRVLSTIKLISYGRNLSEFAPTFALGFFWPLLTGRVPEPSPRWNRLRQLFDGIRHVAYLTLDCPFTGLQWLPSLPGLLDQLVVRHRNSIESFSTELSEILSPVEHATYNMIYHSDVARSATANFAERVFSYLTSSPDATETLSRWQTAGLISELRLPSAAATPLFHIGCARIRSHFHSSDLRETEFEDDLRACSISHPIASRYKPWTSQVMLEPTELLLDAFSKEAPKAIFVGQFLLWLIRRFERLSEEPDDINFELVLRSDLSLSYTHLLERAIQFTFGKVGLRVAPWDLHTLGVDAFRDDPDMQGGVWAAGSALDDAVTKRLLRRPNIKKVPSGWEDRLAELEGLRLLRRWLRRRFPATRPRRRWLVVPSSIRLVSDGKDLIEFDGGLLEISSRTGRMKWWGLETKNGSGSPRRSLERRLSKLNVVGEVHSLTRRHAVAAIALEEHLALRTFNILPDPQMLGGEVAKVATQKIVSGMEDGATPEESERITRHGAKS